MAATVTQTTIEAVVEETTDVAEARSAPTRSTTETEADKIRRQLMLRRRTAAARRALMARRTR